MKQALLKLIFSNKIETSNNEFQEVNRKSKPTFYSQNQLQEDREMNTLKMKAIHPLMNHQKHTSLPHQRLKKKGTQITEALLDSSHNKDTTDHLLGTGVVVTKKQIHEIRKDNIEVQTLLEMEQ